MPSPSPAQTESFYRAGVLGLCALEVSLDPHLLRAAAVVAREWELDAKLDVLARALDSLFDGQGPDLLGLALQVKISQGAVEGFLRTHEQLLATVGVVIAPPEAADADVWVEAIRQLTRLREAAGSLRRLAFG